MAHYEVRFESKARYPWEPGKPVVMEFDREHFTKREWDVVLSMLFMLSGDTAYSVMHVRVFRDGKCAFAVDSETVVDGSTINTFVVIRGVVYRIMNVAE